MKGMQISSSMLIQKKHLSHGSLSSYAKLDFLKKFDTCNNTFLAEARFALFIAEHCSINACDHLTDMCKKVFLDSKIAENMKLHKIKCTSIIKHILYPYFLNDLNNDIDEATTVFL